MIRGDISKVGGNIHMIMTLVRGMDKITWTGKHKLGIIKKIKYPAGEFTMLTD
jgi:hypothetical protein